MRKIPVGRASFFGQPRISLDRTVRYRLILCTVFLTITDIALALSYQPHTGRTNAILLGCSEEDVEDIETFLKASKSSAGHPWLLLTLVSLLQLRRYRNEDELIHTELETALIQAHLNRTDGHGTRTSSKKKATLNNPGDQAYRKLTKNVLELFSRASAVAQDMKLFCKLLDRVLSAVPRVHAPQILHRAEPTIPCDVVGLVHEPLRLLHEALNLRLGALRASAKVLSIDARVRQYPSTFTEKRERSRTWHAHSVTQTGFLNVLCQSFTKLMNACASVP